MNKHKILFKYASRGNGFKFISVITNIISHLDDKENFIILVSADKDDAMIYNKEVLTSIKPYTDSGKVVICFDKSASKIDAINRDMELVTDWDIVVNVSNNVCFNIKGFDELIRQNFTQNFPDTNGQMYFDAGNKDVVVMGKSYYKELGYIYDPRMKHNLFVNYYSDKNDERTKELNLCIIENLKNEFINNVVVISNEIDYLKLKFICDEHLSRKIIPVITDVRPTFNDYFRLTSRLFNDNSNINIIANLDIIIPSETLGQKPDCDKHKIASDYLLTLNTCLALTRWDVKDTNNYRSGAVFFNTPDSQDAWFFSGGVPKISGADFTLGIAGCDNKVAHLLEQSGYNVINPSRILKTYHYHLTEIRNYTNVVGHAIERLQPPYKLLHPTE